MFQKVFQNSGITYQPQLVARISEPSTVSALGCMISQPSNPMRTPLPRGVPMVKSSFGVASAMGGPCPPTSKSVPWRWMGSKLSAAAGLPIRQKKRHSLRNTRECLCYINIIYIYICFLLGWGYVFFQSQGSIHHLAWKAGEMLHMVIVQPGWREWKKVPKWWN